MPVIATARTAANVRAELARQHVTQTAVTQLLNLSHSAVSRRMRGETPFRDRELQQIAQHLNIPITVLFGESEAHAS